MLSKRSFLSGRHHAPILVDPCFAKNLDDILIDYTPGELLLLKPLADSVVPGYSFHACEAGTLLLFQGRIVGAYLGCNVAVAEDHQGQGLGAELIVKHYTDQGELPIWHHDKVGFSPAGLAAHTSAWRQLCQPQSVRLGTPL